MGDRPIFYTTKNSMRMIESDCLRVQSEAGGNLHLKLNIMKRLIANKYHEGKLKRTLKRELKSA